jgi:hypothetical protein
MFQGNQCGWFKRRSFETKFFEATIPCPGKMEIYNDMPRPADKDVDG